MAGLALVVLIGSLDGSSIVPTAYQTVKNASVALAQRTVINCTGSLTCSDVGGQTEFNVATGAGGVTSVATGCGLSGGTITTTGTVKSSQAVNAQTGTTYAFVDGDCSKLVTFTNGSSIAASLPQAGASSLFVAGWWMHVENRGAGTLTITPATSTIDGAATLVLGTNQGAYIGSDGSNYFTMRGAGITSVATGCGLSGGTITISGTVKSSQAVNAQTGTSYPFVDGDCSKLVTFTNGSSIAASLPQAGASSLFVAGWWMHVENRGAGTLTITPTTSTIDGAASLALVTNQGVYIGSDGANYFTMRGMGATTNQNIRTFGGSFDGAGSPLTASKVAYVTVPYGCTIAAYNILVDAGTADFDVWKIATGTAIPAVGNTIISGTNYLAISSGTALHSTTTSSFTSTTVTANDIVGIQLHAVTSATIAQLTIQCNAT
jgi:hypothetical protein